MISNLFCVNMNLNLDPLYEYMESEHRIYNNNVPLRFTFVLNGYLLGILVTMNILLKCNRQNIQKINMYVLKQDSIVLILLFLYEYLFFQNIILSTFKITDFKFLLTTLIGIFPFILLYSVLGDSFATFIDLKDFDIKKGLDNKTLVIFISSIVLIVILSIIAIFLEKKYKKEFKSN